MSSSRSRRVILAFIAFAVGAGSLLVAETALADTALFRVKRQFYAAPLPPATSPGGAGRYMNYIEPYVSIDGMGNYNYPPATAIVQPGNPIGGAFTLPSGFIDVDWTCSCSWAPPGQTSASGWNYYNGPGRFGPSNPHAATMTTRIVFPTTLGNPYPNLGAGNPVTPTTSFSGLYDFSRAGSINVTPGPNRFGGTMKLFHRPGAFGHRPGAFANWYQYIYYFAPAYYKAYGSFLCQDPPGVTCTPSVVSSIGDFTSSEMVTRFLLNVTGTGTGKQSGENTARATTPIDPAYGTFPTRYGNASYIAAKGFYLHIIHPWTTGFAVAHNPLSPYTNVRPQLQGYDTSLGGANITVTDVGTSAVFNSTLSTVTYNYHTYKQYLKGVTRVVSMVRPRLLHHYAPYPTISGQRNGIRWFNPSYQSAQAWTMKVFFLPEPTGTLLLGAGVAVLLGLSRMRRR